MIFVKKEHLFVVRPPMDQREKLRSLSDLTQDSKRPLNRKTARLDLSDHLGARLEGCPGYLVVRVMWWPR